MTRRISIDRVWGGMGALAERATIRVRYLRSPGRTGAVVTWPSGWPSAFLKTASKVASSFLAPVLVKRPETAQASRLVKSRGQQGRHAQPEPDLYAYQP